MKFILKYVTREYDHFWPEVQATLIKSFLHTNNDTVRAGSSQLLHTWNIFSRVTTKANEFEIRKRLSFSFQMFTNILSKVNSQG